MPELLGFTTFGDGLIRVIVLHDWFCDHTSWDSALLYLTPTLFTYVFADLRGYGASREIDGAFTLEEAAADVLALADHLNWRSFSLLGHSMSGMVVQRLAQLAPDRIHRIVAVTPAAPGGMHLDERGLHFFKSIALADDEGRFSALSALCGNRLSETWTRYKLRRWRETADPEAAAKYVEMWGSTDISQHASGIRTPMLIVAAAADAPPFQPAALEVSMLPFYPNGKLFTLAESGHYPMQEQPPLLATAIERFLGEDSGANR